MDHFGGGFGWLFMLLFWGLVIFGIVALVKWIATSSRGDTRRKPPLETLNERYARGEIDRDEYEQKKRDLQS